MAKILKTASMALSTTRRFARSTRTARVPIQFVYLQERCHNSYSRMHIRRSAVTWVLFRQVPLFFRFSQNLFYFFDFISLSSLCPPPHKILHNFRKVLPLHRVIHIIHLVFHILVSRLSKGFPPFMEKLSKAATRNFPLLSFSHFIYITSTFAYMHQASPFFAALRFHNVDFTVSLHKPAKKQRQLFVQKLPLLLSQISRLA